MVKGILPELGGFQPPMQSNPQWRIAAARNARPYWMRRCPGIIKFLSTLATQFSVDEDWIFASPVPFGAPPWSYPWLWCVFQKAAAAAQIGKLGTHAMRHSIGAGWTR